METISAVLAAELNAYKRGEKNLWELSSPALLNLLQERDANGRRVARALGCRD